MPLHLERDDIARFYADAWRRAEEQARQEVSEALARRRVGLASMSDTDGTMRLRLSRPCGRGKPQPLLGMSHETAPLTPRPTVSAPGACRGSALP